jgi:hypothetical protein
MIRAGSKIQSVFSRNFIDGNGYLWVPTTGRYFQIPYRAILPQKIDNLLVAGRCISVILWRIVPSEI